MKRWTWALAMIIAGCSSGTSGTGGTTGGSGNSTSSTTSSSGTTGSSATTGGSSSSGSASGSSGGSGSTGDAGSMVSQVIGVDGGVVQGGGVTLSIPAGAVDSDTTITVTPDAGSPPAQYPALSPLYAFGPDGTVFAHPIDVSLPLPSGASAADVYWSRKIDDGGLVYDDLGGTVANGQVTVQVVHFSSGFVGTPSGSRTITGSQVVTWKTPERIINVPQDFGVTPINAYVPNDAGGYDLFPGEGTDAGTFAIPNVPNGSYLLQTGDTYVWTSVGAIDLGSFTVGRPDELPLIEADAGITTVSFYVDNMVPWDDQHGWLEILAPDVNSWYFAIEPFDPANPPLGNIPDAGDTSLVGTSFDLAAPIWGDFPWANLIQGSKGDVITLGQLASVTNDAGFTYQAMVATFDPQPFDAVPGGNVDLHGSFVKAASDHTLDVSLDPAAFRALVIQDLPDGGEASLAGPPNTANTQTVEFDDFGNPAPVSYGAFFDLQGQPGGTGDGQFGATSDFCNFNFTLDDAAIHTSQMEYAVPLNGTWGPFAGWGHHVRVRYKAPGASSFSGMWVSDVSDQAVEPAQATITLAPQLSLVRSPQINGQDFFASQTGVGLTPTLSWQPPTIGTAARYRVNVHHWLANGTATQQDIRMPVLLTDQTSITLPPGILQTGDGYSFVIEAEMGGNPNATQAPLRSALPVTNSQVASGLMQP